MLDPLELELQLAVSLPIGSLEKLSRLSSPQILFIYF